jgi:DNA-3-methyladenine glycosylase II
VPAARRPRLDTPRAIAYLRERDATLGAIIDRVGRLQRARRGGDGNYYAVLVRAIVGQQLSTIAARTIHTRLLDHFGGHDPTPQQILQASTEDLRAVGLSGAKVGFLRSLAEHVLSGELELERLPELSDEEVIAELVAVKGIGEWTAHMFLMFELQRPDVLAVGDLGIRRAVQLAYGLEKMPAPKELTAIGEPWSPHRTLACLYLWASLDNTPA